MTNTESLSAQIARLEADVAYIPEGRCLLDSLDGELRDLMARLDEVARRLAQAEMSERLLEDLNGYAVRLLTSGTLVADVASTAAAPQILEQEPDSEPAVSAPLVAEAPASTPAEAAEQTSGSLPADTSDDEVIFTTVPQRVSAWVANQAPGTVFSAGDCARDVHAAFSTVNSHLSSMHKRGAFERVEGTGLPGIPSQFRIPRPADDVDAAHEEPAVTPEEPSAPPASFGQLSPRAAVLGYLQDHPAEEVCIPFLSRELGQEGGDIEEALNALVRAGQVQSNLTASPIAYALAGSERPAPKLFEEAAPSGPAPARQALVALPDRLTMDERSMYDQLRRAPDGLTLGVLGSYLNWSGTRTKKVSDALEREGHIVERDGRWHITSAQEGVA